MPPRRKDHHLDTLDSLIADSEDRERLTLNVSRLEPDEWQHRDAAFEAAAAHLHITQSAISQRIKQLERELRRKDAALAETAALLVLRKKAEALWGKDEDE